MRTVMTSHSQNQKWTVGWTIKYTVFFNAYVVTLISLRFGFPLRKLEIIMKLSADFGPMAPLVLLTHTLISKARTHLHGRLPVPVLSTCKRTRVYAGGVKITSRNTRIPVDDFLCFTGRIHLVH